MQDLHIRPMTPDDYPRLVEITNRCNPVPVSLAEYVRRVETRQAEGPFLRLVAEAPGGIIAGVGTVFHPVWRAEGIYYVHASVDPDCRGQGTGSALYEAVARQAREWGARALLTEAWDHVPDYRTFAEHRGFQVKQHYFQSELDLQTFDPAPFMDAVESAQAAGYRFVTMADVDGPEARRKLYELDMECSQDEPGFDPAGFTAYEQWAHHVFADQLYDPGAVVIALLGEEWAGMSGLHFLMGEQTALVFFTGVRRAHRGRKLAQALKLLTGQYARERGCLRIRTGNNERNPAMLAVNRKFGFKPLPGVYQMEREA